MTGGPVDAGGDAAAAARAAMVAEQLRAGGIKDERVLEAMGAVPREAFLPESQRAHAYDDAALPIGHGQTVSQPWVVAAICAGLELTGDEEVLEVGTGSGYSAAVLGRLARSVVSIELIEELAEHAREALSALGVANVEVQAGDGTGAIARAGAREAEPEGRSRARPLLRPLTFDAIAVHAAAPALPGALAQALRPGGRLVIPIAEGFSDLLVAFHRTDRGGGDEPRLKRRVIAPCRFVPLLGEGGFPSRGR